MDPGTRIRRSCDTVFSDFVGKLKKARGGVPMFYCFAATIIIKKEKETPHRVNSYDGTYKLPATAMAP